MSLRPKPSSYEEDLEAYRLGKLDTSHTKVIRGNLNQPDLWKNLDLAKKSVGPAHPNTEACQTKTNAFNHRLSVPALTSVPGKHTSAPGKHTSAPGKHTSAPGKHTSAIRFEIDNEDVHFEQQTERDCDPISCMEQADSKKNLTGIITSIKERVPDDEIHGIIMPLEGLQPTGFPNPFQVSEREFLSEESASTNPQKKSENKRPMSLFKKKLLAMRGEVVVHENYHFETMGSDSISPIGNQVATETMISQENEQKIATMSSSEISAAQKEIFDQFDHSVLKKLVAKIGSSAKVTEHHEDYENDQEFPFQNANLEAKSIEDLSWIKTEEDLDIAMNMLPERERDKLRWTGRIHDETAKQMQAEQQKNAVSESSLTQLLGQEHRPSTEKARFDLNGFLVDPETFPLVSSGLFHHGDEQEKGGYTLKELEDLARSQVPAQRALSLNCMGKILMWRHLCLYESFASHPLFLLPTKLAMVLRLALDSTNSTVVSSALFALHSFLVPVTFQRSLTKIWNSLSDSLLLPERVPRAQGSVSIFAPSLEDKDAPEAIQSQKSDHSNSSTIQNDLECIDASPVLGFLETGLLDRLAYLLGVNSNRIGAGVSLDESSMAHVVRILAHIVMHSQYCATCIFSNSSLRNVLELKFCEAAKHKAVGEDLILALTLFFQSLVASNYDIASALASENDGELYFAAVSLAFGNYRDSENCAVAISSTTLLRFWQESGFYAYRSTIYKLRAEKQLAVNPSIFYLMDAKSTLSTVVAASLITQSERLCTPSVRFLYKHIKSSTDGNSFALDLSIINQTPFPMSQSPVRVHHEPFGRLADKAMNEISSFRNDGIKSLQEIDAWIVWIKLAIVLARREEALRVLFARKNGVREGLLCVLGYFRYHRTAAEESLASKEIRVGGAASFLSPQGIAWERCRSKCILSTVQLLLRLFGTTLPPTGAFLSSAKEQAERQIILCLSMPHVPVSSGQSRIALKIIEALFSPSVGLPFKNASSRSDCSLAFKNALGLGVGFHGKDRKKCMRSEFSFSLLKYPQRKLMELWRKKWEEALSAWPLIPLFASSVMHRDVLAHREEDFSNSKCLELNPEADYLVDVISAIGLTLLNASAIRPESIIVTLIRFFADSCDVSPSLHCPGPTRALNELLDLALAQLLAKERDQWFYVLAGVAGGEFRFRELIQSLVVSYNETLNGHETASALLLLTLRADTESSTRAMLWVDLLDGHLLHLVRLPCENPVKALTGEKDRFYSPIETNLDTLQCMCNALSSRALTKANNEFLFSIAVKQIAGYLWKSSGTAPAGVLSWNRLRLLKQLVSSNTYWEIVITTASGVVFDYESELGEPRPHHTAANALNTLAREDQNIWNTLEADERISLVEVCRRTS